MTPNPCHGLGPEAMSIIGSILSLYSDKIEVIGLFGSRAQGTYRDNSDIDIVVYGTLTRSDIDHINTLFDESLLPVKVDIIAYHLIDYPPLKAHIDATMTVLVTPCEIALK